MQATQIKRRKVFQNKLKEGKRGYVYQELSVVDGINKSYNSEYPDIRMEGQAVLHYKGRFLSLGTSKDKNLNIIVASNKSQRLLIDVKAADIHESFDVGFAKENSSDFIFAAYIYNGIEEWLYGVDAFAPEVSMTCIGMITIKDDSPELATAYNWIATGIWHQKKMDEKKINITGDMKGEAEDEFS